MQQENEHKDKQQETKQQTRDLQRSATTLISGLLLAVGGMYLLVVKTEIWYVGILIMIMSVSMIVNEIKQLNNVDASEEMQEQEEPSQYTAVRRERILEWFAPVEPMNRNMIDAYGEKHAKIENALLVTNYSVWAIHVETEEGTHHAEQLKRMVAAYSLEDIYLLCHGRWLAANDDQIEVNYLSASCTVEITSADDVTYRYQLQTDADLNRIKHLLQTKKRKSI